MGYVFYIAAIVTLAGAVGAMTMRKLVHAALFLAISFSGVSVLFLVLNAPFAAFAQLLVYVGAVAILILFAILLTRGGGESVEEGTGIITGLAVTVLVGGTISTCILSSKMPGIRVAHSLVPSTKTLGEQLVTRQVVSLEVIAVLLTVALLGAIVLALPEKKLEESK